MNGSDSLQGALPLLVLKILSRRGPLHGYGITTRIEEISEEMLSVEEGSLYPALHRMEELGFREVGDHREQTPRAGLRNNCGQPQAIEGNRRTLASRHGGRPGFAKSLGAEILEEPCPGFHVSLMYFAVTA